LYHGKDLDEILTGMIDGGLYGLPPWAVYVHRWQEVLKNNRKLLMATVFYEDLLDHTGTVVSKLLHVIGKKHDPGRLLEAVHRQGFVERKKSYRQDKSIAKSRRNLNQKLMRHGVAGDWINHFNAKQIKWVMGYWRYEMELLGYEC
jgi:hypothetical protein